MAPMRQNASNHSAPNERIRRKADNTAVASRRTPQVSQCRRNPLDGAANASTIAIKIKSGPIHLKCFATCSHHGC